MDITATSIIKKLLVLFLVFSGLYFAREFLMPLAIGGVLAALFLPMTQWLERKKVPSLLAALACLLSLFTGMVLVGYLIAWQISELSNDAAFLKSRTIDGINAIQQYIFTTFSISIEQQQRILSEQRPFFSEILKGMAGYVLPAMSYFVLIQIYMMLMLFYRSHIRQFVLMFSKPDKQAEMNRVINSVARVSQHYLVGLSKMIVCLWIMYGIGFSALGVKNAVFFAVLCGLLEIVPFIGNITGTTITILMAAVQGGSPTMLAGIAVVYGTVQFIQGWLLEPLIVGSQVKINPLFTILALVAGDLIWGIPGIFLAIPLIAMFKIVCDNIEPLKPFGFLIGETETKDKPPGFLKRLFSKKKH
jgi:predicted PurR-regulated permease PerM